MNRSFVVVLVVVVFALAACGGGAQGNGAPSGGGAAGNAENGQRLFALNAVGSNNAPGCATCHSVEAGRTLVGPTMAGIATKGAATINSADYNGAATTAAEFLHESIVDPNVYVETGFSPGIMPQNYGTALSDQEINDMVAYLLTLD